MPLPTTDQIEKARLKAAQAKERLAKLEARLGEAARKLDTRRKIILGGLLLDAAAKDERYAKVVQSLMSRIDREQDRMAFENWTPPALGSAQQSGPNELQGNPGGTGQPAAGSSPSHGQHSSQNEGEQVTPA